MISASVMKGLILLNLHNVRGEIQRRSVSDPEAVSKRFFIEEDVIKGTVMQII